MDELKAVESLGFITSPELSILLDKSIQSVIRILNDLENQNQINIIIFKKTYGQVRVYTNGEIYNNIRRFKE